MIKGFSKSVFVFAAFVSFVCFDLGLQNARATQVRFENCSWTEKGQVPIRSPLDKTLTYTKISLSGNFNFENYINCIQQSPNLTDLEIAGLNSFLTDAQRADRVQKISDALKERNLTDLSFPNAVASDLKILAPLLSNMNLRHLNFMGSSDLGDEGVKIIAGIIKKQDALEALYLSRTGMTDKEAKPILKALYKHPNIKGLNLGYNKLTGDIVPDICDVIAECPNLCVLQLLGNDVFIEGSKDESTKEGASRVRDFVKKNRALFMTFGFLEFGTYVFQPLTDKMTYENEWDLYYRYPCSLYLGS